MRFDDDLRLAFLKIATDRRHGAGVQLVSEQSLDGPVLLLEGRADVLRHTPDGKVVIFDQVFGGTVLGVHAMITGDAHASTAVARGPGRSAVASRAAFRKLMEDPAFDHALRRSLVDEIRELSSRIFEFSTLQVRDRLVKELLRCADHGDQRRCRACRLSPSPTQSDLAARISTHREAVSREMSRLARLGLIERRGRDIVIPSRAALASAAARATDPRPS